MGDTKTGKAVAAKKAHQGVGSGSGAQIDDLVRKAPRFWQLAKAAKGGETEVSDAQKKFLDDFAAEVAKSTENGS